MASDLQTPKAAGFKDYYPTEPTEHATIAQGDCALYKTTSGSSPSSCIIITIIIKYFVEGKSKVSMEMTRPSVEENKLSVSGLITTTTEQEGDLLLGSN